jgi:hypothetical protein
MSWPGGPWIAGLIGAALIGVAIFQFHQHTMHQRFMQRLARFRMSAGVAEGVERAGRAGYASRAIVLTIVGIFFIVAAVQHDPQEAVGLSGALQTLAERTWGQLVLWVVAIGLFLFGCFCFAEARYRRAT